MQFVYFGVERMKGGDHNLRSFVESLFSQGSKIISVEYKMLLWLFAL